MDKIQTAYAEGRKAACKYATIEDAVYADAYDITMDRIECIAWEMGFEGAPLEVVTGWRYGDIPEAGVSGNYLDQRYERGVSLMAIDGGEAGTETTTVEGIILGACGRPIVRIRGYYSGRGATGEPLVIGAERL